MKGGQRAVFFEELTQSVSKMAGGSGGQESREGVTNV